MPHKYATYFLLSALLCLGGRYACAQGSVGFERFQYKRFQWLVYKEKQYTLYLPAKCNDTMYRLVIREMPLALARLKHSAIQDLKDINLIIYPSLLSFYQTNIGIANPHKVSVPMFNEKAKRVVVCYDGNYQRLRDQLYEGLSRALWESQIEVTTRHALTDYPNKVEVTKKKTPYWYKEGCIKYFAHGWPIAAEDRLKSILGDTSISNWPLLLKQDPVLAGHAFCYFLSLKFIEKAPAQIAFQLTAQKGFPIAVSAAESHTVANTWGAKVLTSFPYSLTALTK